MACSSDRPDGSAEEKASGKLALALKATAPSGSVYMLRNAFFEITDVRTGEFVQNLTTENGLPDAEELTTLLLTGNYTIRLFPGWFLERISGPGGGGTGGSSSGTGGTPGSMGGSPAGGASNSGGSGSTSTAGTKMIPVELSASAGAGEEPPGDGGASSSGGEPSSGGSVGTAGSGSAGKGGVGGSVGVGGSSSTGIVQAELRSDAVQFFSIFGLGDTFVNYQFEVDGEIVDFNKGTLHVGIGVVEAKPPCEAPEGVTMPERMLMETNVEAVKSVSLAQVFEAIATNGGHGGDGVALYRQLFDSYATADQGEVPEAVHCGDESIDGVPTLNGFRIDCNRAEAQHVNDMEKFFATAFVNRMDLAPANGAHCGQQRMIFANPSNGRTFIIVEAQIPNPTPEAGIDGCKPLAQFWLNQNSIPSAAVRGSRLQQAFLTGTEPELAVAGFGPFFTAENLTVGSGQIRTNQFDSIPWTLREFKLAIDGDQLRTIPFPVAESPNGALWDENSGLAQGEACRESFLTALDGVLTDDRSLMSFVVDQACKNSESRNDGSENYASNMSPGFSDLIQEKLDSIGSSLTPIDIANRARFAGSCIGCHNESQFSNLGNGVFAPASDDFPQVMEQSVQCTGGEAGNCFRTSTALRQVFLPGRMAVMSNLLGFPIVPNDCDDGGSGTGGTSSMGGSGPIPGPGSGGGSSGPKNPIPKDPTPAPIVVIELPSADVPVEELQEEDQEIRDAYGDVTISGRNAKSTH